MIKRNREPWIMALSQAKRAENVWSSRTIVIHFACKQIKITPHPSPPVFVKRCMTLTRWTKANWHKEKKKKTCINQNKADFYIPSSLFWFCFVYYIFFLHFFAFFFSLFLQASINVPLTRIRNVVAQWLDLFSCMNGKTIIKRCLCHREYKKNRSKTRKKNKNKIAKSFIQSAQVKRIKSKAIKNANIYLSLKKNTKMKAKTNLTDKEKK